MKDSSSGFAAEKKLVGGSCIWSPTTTTCPDRKRHGTAPSSRIWLASSKTVTSNCRAFDLDVVLDVLLDRAPSAEAASALWAAVETDKARGLVTAHAATTIHALMKRSRGGAFADRAVADLLAVFNVARVSEAVLTAALSLRLAAVDDAISAAAAASARSDLLVTRDPTRFRGSPVEVVSPGEALARLSGVRRAASRR